MTTDIAALLRNAFGSGDSSDPVDHGNPALKPGERRDAAVLFLDLEGFTAMSSRLDHETIHEITVSIMNQLVLTARSYSGYVDKIEGDRIMVLFGAVRAGENDSLRAVMCGFDMLKTVSRAGSVLNNTGYSISARIGISSGPVTVAPDAIGHLTAMGNTVNLASRLEENAQSNSILVSGRVRSLCGTSAEWNKGLTLSVKGISEQVHAWSPSAMIRCTGETMDECLFAGRRNHLAELEALLNETLSKTDTPRHLLLEIHGEAGVGKTALAHRFISRFCPLHLVLRGSSVPEPQPPYTLWSSVLANLLMIRGTGSVSRERFNSQLSAHCPECPGESLPFLGRLVAASPPAGGPGDLDRRAIALETNLALRNLLQTLSNGRKLVLLLEGTQWIDSTDRNILEFVMMNTATPNPMVVLLTGRSLSGLPPMARLNRGNPVYRYAEVPLEELTEDESTELSVLLLAERSGSSHPVSADAASFLYTQSSGNPLFLKELALHLAETKALELRNDCWKLSMDFRKGSTPETISGLLHSRLDNLPDSWRNTLMLCSVLGQDFMTVTLEKVIEKLSLDTDIADDLSGLVERQMLVPWSQGDFDGYQFRSSLVEKAAYGRLLSHNLKLIHRAAAESLEELFTGDEERTASRLATHWEGAGCRETAATWALKAQEHASFNHQHKAVLFWGGKLLEWLEQSSDHYMKVLERNSVALRYTGESQEQWNTLQLMDKLASDGGWPEWQAKCATAIGSFHNGAARHSEALVCFEKALDISIEYDLEWEQSSVLGNLGVLHGDLGKLKEAKDFFERARILQQKLKDTRGEANTMGNLAILHRKLQQPEKAIDYLQKALEYFERTGNRSSTAITRGNLGNIHQDLGNYSRGEELYTGALETFRSIGDRMSSGIFMCNLGILHTEWGKHDTALKHFRNALAVFRETGDPRTTGWALCQTGLLMLQTGDYRKALELCGDALELFRGAGDQRFASMALSATGYARCQSGDIDGSLADYRKACETITSMKLPDTDFRNTTIPHRRALLKAGIQEGSIPYPSHWPAST